MDFELMVCIILCALALVILFFPFTFWIHGHISEKEGVLECFLFKKKLASKSCIFNKPKEYEVKCHTPENTTETPHKSNDSSLKPEEIFEAKEEAAKAPENLEQKPSLTDKEFWTILLTPEFDALAWSSTKKLALGFSKLCHLKFFNSYVQGIRLDYAQMGNLAALNSFLKTYPYIGDIDFRMDWTMDHEPYGEFHLRLRVNLSRFIGLLIRFAFYGGIVLVSFWRRRSHVLKTKELPELGWFRSKILKIMVEE